ncbi:alkaline shock response membrane anchor protein AmaP [Corynebacterium uropygiale]|uniref:Alkaline shock response membrane anchor protein AmaP n=1 Tax=Corynebacterium uropygiale TaxID=1775911 RepID=A0A9X1TXB8_9CORY|nr:alkaline shock response membrane anchor protein AmaP [Corynebacterium uropygiale]MCF4005885.1 alkaline shock response membrane anchor protein AmaP [Corynebacterium uropygiale]
MNRGLAAADRIIVFLVGLLILAGGVWVTALRFNCPPAQELGKRVDTKLIAGIPGESWYLYLLIGILVVSIIIGLWLIIANIRPHGFNRVRSSASAPEGTIGLTMGKIADAVGESIERQVPRVESVSQKVSVDRNRPTVRWTITAHPGVRLEQLRSVLEQSERDFREAIRDVDVDTTYRLHVQPADR